MHSTRWNWIHKTLEGIALAASIMVAFALIWLVAARYWFDLPAAGLHTIALIAALWLYMTGALLASRKREHLAVDILAHSLRSPRAQALHRLVVAVVTFVIIALFCYWTYRMFAWGSRFSTTMPSLNIPIWVPQLAIALNAVGSLGYAARDVAQAFQAVRTGG